MPSTFFSRAKKTFKRGTRAATKATGKRYGVSYGRQGLKMSKSSVSRIAKDVMMIKSRLNVEKKSKTGLVQTGEVAQMDGNTFGFVTHDLTPIWTQGVGEDQRVGNSLKLTGFNMKIQLRGQQNCTSARRMKLMIIKTTDTTTPLANIVNDIFDPNPLTGIIDFHSNWDYSDNKRVHKVIRTFPMYLRSPDQGTQAARSIKDYNISLKLNDVLRFENNLVSSPNDCRYFLLIMCDTGNHGGGASSNPGCMVQDFNSGVEYQFHNKFWLVDN